MGLILYDPTGLGGDLCVVELGVPPFTRYVADCNFQDHPAASRGFSNDGSDPCVIGHREMPVSTWVRSWGRVKFLYR